jgi:glycosyltransferase involved in cell wall biosynthesis
MKNNVSAYPLVSICIPTYNGETYIVEALESAIKQTYSNLEIIVSDDDSSDDTLKRIDAYQSKTVIPIKIHHHTPSGIGANWNNCVTKANGDYIKFLFQDDVLEPNCILKMMDLAITNPQLGMVYCKRNFIYTQLTPKLKKFIEYYSNLHMYWDDVKVETGILSGKTYLKDRQLLNSPKNKIGEPTNVLLKKSCFDKVGYFNETLEQTLDSEYWYRVMCYYDVGFIDRPLVKFRLHEKQASVINKQRDIPDNNLIYKLYYKDLFWHLHPSNQWKLLKLFHPFLKTLVSIKHYFYAN